mgnify:CR=1 FL=1
MITILFIGYFFKYCDHDHNPHSKDCDYGHSSIKTKKYDISMRTVIIVAILKYMIFCEDAIMVAFLYIPAVRIFAVHFFEVINAEAFAPFVTGEHFCI